MSKDVKSAGKAVANRSENAIAIVARVGIVMGSKNDWPTLKPAADMLENFGIAFEVRVVSAHRTPDLLHDYGRTARARGLKVIIAGAGGAAHLPGMLAALTPLPVLAGASPLRGCE